MLRPYKSGVFMRDLVLNPDLSEFNGLTIGN
jgi:hypothetical protein